MDTFFERASEAMGGNPSPDQLKVVASILSAYPCAALFRLIPDKNVQLKHLYSISITSYIMLSFLHYYKGMIHITGSCLFTYVFMKYYRNKNGPWINFVITMASMSVW
jgi:lysophospholipid acyltransferase